MAYPCWFLWVVMAYMCVPGFGSTCRDKSICSSLGNKAKDCMRLCMPPVLTEFPELDESSALKVIAAAADDHLLFSIVLSGLLSKDKQPESDPVGDHSEDRRSYSMEHFRWGKPSGRKRRPVKVFTSFQEVGGGSSEGSFSPRARRHQRNEVYAANKDTKASERKRNQDNQGSRVNAKSSPQQRKAYRMTHFRWGSPTESKRNASLMKMLGAKPHGELAQLLRNILVKKDMGYRA